MSLSPSKAWVGSRLVKPTRLLLNFFCFIKILFCKLLFIVYKSLALISLALLLIKMFFSWQSVLTEHIYVRLLKKLCNAWLVDPLLYSGNNCELVLFSLVFRILSTVICSVNGSVITSTVNPSLFYYKLESLPSRFATRGNILSYIMVAIHSKNFIKYSILKVENYK